MKKAAAAIIILLSLSLALLLSGCSAQTEDGAITDSAMMSEAEQQIEAVSVNYQGEEITLADPDISTLSGLFAQAEVEEFLYPEHNQGQYSDPLFTINIGYADETYDTVFSTETGKVFYKFSGTAGADGTVGYILVRSEDIFDLLSNLNWQQ